MRYAEDQFTYVKLICANRFGTQTPTGCTFNFSESVQLLARHES